VLPDEARIEAEDGMPGSLLQADAETDADIHADDPGLNDEDDAVDDDAVDDDDDDDDDDVDVDVVVAGEGGMEKWTFDAELDLLELVRPEDGVGTTLFPVEVTLDVDADVDVGVDVDANADDELELETKEDVHLAPTPTTDAPFDDDCDCDDDACKKTFDATTAFEPEVLVDDMKIRFLDLIS
jgi:hypothetical protein